LLGAAIGHYTLKSLTREIIIEAEGKAQETKTQENHKTPPTAIPTRTAGKGEDFFNKCMEISENRGVETVRFFQRILSNGSATDFKQGRKFKRVRRAFSLSEFELPHHRPP
jgi:hypothetical protein